MFSIMYHCNRFGAIPLTKLTDISDANCIDKKIMWEKIRMINSFMYNTRFYPL